MTPQEDAGCTASPFAGRPPPAVSPVLAWQVTGGNRRQHRASARAVALCTTLPRPGTHAVTTTKKGCMGKGPAGDGRDSRPQPAPSGPPCAFSPCGRPSLGRSPGEGHTPRAHRVRCRRDRKDAGRLCIQVTAGAAHARTPRRPHSAPPAPPCRLRSAPCASAHAGAEGRGHACVACSAPNPSLLIASGCYRARVPDGGCGSEVAWGWLVSNEPVLRPPAGAPCTCPSAQPGPACEPRPALRSLEMSPRSILGPCPCLWESAQPLLCRPGPPDALSAAILRLVPRAPRHIAAPARAVGGSARRRCPLPRMHRHKGGRPA